MNHEVTIAMLLRGRRDAPLSPEEWKRVKARCAWVKEKIAALREAQQKVTEAWDRMFDALPHDLSNEELDALNLPEPPEQAEVDALFAQIRAVIDEDRWPRDLYFSGI